MAFKATTISLFLIFNIVLAMAGHALAGRAGPIKPKEEDKKQPEWAIQPDGSVIIPGIGRILVPMPGGSGGYGPPNFPSAGNGHSDSTHIPGKDDTSMPSPSPSPSPVSEAPAPSAT